MRTTGRRDVLTTGEVARICGVAARTVTKWFDTGKLRGYRIPGSRDRRIPRTQLIAFMRAHDLPLDGLDLGRCRILLVATPVGLDLADIVNASDRYEVRAAEDTIRGAMFAQRMRPHLVVVGAADEEAALAFCRCIKEAEDLHATVLALLALDQEHRRIRLTGGGFDGCLTSPLTPAALAAAAQEATNLFS
jgi:excisionase family DNA binding protein